MTARVASLLLLACSLVTPVSAQGYRLRVDSRIRSVAFRGVTPDSVPAADVVVSSTGGFETADGFAVRCRPGEAFCHYHRPGGERRGGPFVTTASLSMWGLGVAGLSARGTARVGLDVGDADVWPGTDPALQLVEGFIEYASERLTAEAGRTQVTSRLGYTGLDGAKLTFRPTPETVSAMLYGGWGLARGVALPVTSPALDPLDDFQPRDRQLIFGGTLAATFDPIRVRALYQREVDPRSDNFVSERVGIDLAVRPIRGFSFAGGADYDLAAGWLGSAEAALTFAEPRERVTVTGGVRRYRPHFDLWTIWGAFSPVPYRAGFGVLALQPHDRVRLRARGEVFEFDAAEAATPLATAERSGWRWSVGGAFVPHEQLAVDLDYHAAFGPGASSLGFEGRATWRPVQTLDLTAMVASLLRPLEFRFSESNVLLLGLDARYQLYDRVAVSFGLQHYDEERDRPDAAAFQWNQLRVTGGIRFGFGSGADSGRLPPAILRIPTRGGGQ